MIKLPGSLPLVSVIITTYNYAKFLPKAIESVLTQTYKNFEIIIIDDGSSDNPKSVIKESRQLKYFYQENKGISAARNAGIKQSKGNYLLFLDADDWLEKDALEKNLAVIKNETHVAFVSGNYYFLHAENNVLEHITVSIKDHHYVSLLKRNYIGMLAAVMFQKWIFKDFQFDETLKACEDYDLYLTIARKYPVIHHQQFIATYYFHGESLSHNYKMMMDSVAAVIKKQSPYIKSNSEKTAYCEGLEQWKYYDYLLQKNAKTSLKSETFLH